MANKADRTILVRDRAIAGEDAASDRVMDAQREVLRRQYYYPDTQREMRSAIRELTTAREALADSRRIAEQADRNCETAFTGARARRIQVHRERYDALDDEIEDEILFGGEQGGDSAANAEAVDSSSDSSDDEEEDPDYEGYFDTLPPPQPPRTRSQGTLSPFSLSGEAEYTHTLQPSTEAEESDNQGANDTKQDN